MLGNAKDTTDYQSEHLFHPGGDCRLGLVVEL